VCFCSKMIGIKDRLSELAQEGYFLDLQAQTAVSDYVTAVDAVVGNYFRHSLSVFLIGSVGFFSCCYLWRKVKKEKRESV